MLVWRDKVLFDAIRPTTVVHAVKGNGPSFSTYGGPFQGEQTIPPLDWQPYIRTMPHAEYPSGSSCVCTAYAETMQELTGTDSTTIPIVRVIEQGSSKLEPGVTPASDLTFTYNAWSEIQEICSVSRLHGGMHFSQAVPSGQELCSGLAPLVVSKANLLLTGDANGAMVDFNDRTIHVKTKLYPKNNGPTFEKGQPK